ncbi:hypothetical protein ACQP3J_31700, partial [Escherichia coli]
MKTALSLGLDQATCRVPAQHALQNKPNIQKTNSKLQNHQKNRQLGGGQSDNLWVSAHCPTGRALMAGSQDEMG